MLGFLEKRENDIATLIEETRSNKVESNELLTKKQEELKEARVHSQEIVARAKETAKKEQDKLIKDAKLQSKQIVDEAQKEIEAQVKSAKSKLVDEISTIAIDLSQKVLQKNIDAKENEALVNKYIEKL